eukprot:g28801.t1
MKSNKSRDPRKTIVVVNKPAAFVAKPTLDKFEEIDDAWAGLTVEAMMNEKPEYGKIEVEELYKLPPEPIKVANPLALYADYAFGSCQMADANEQDKTKEAPMPQLLAKKSKVEELPKLKRCAHMEINGCLAWVRAWNPRKGLSIAAPGVLVGYNLCRRLYRVYLKREGKVVEQRNVRFNAMVRGYTANVEEYPWGGDEERQTVVRDDVGTLGWKNATNLPGETENLPSDDSSTEAMKNENSEDSSIVIVEHNSSGDYDDVRRPAPMPGLEVAHEKTGQSYRIPRTDLPVIHENKGKAPKDIEGNITASNIVSGRRVRKQTPAGTPTHTYHMATTDETDTHEPMSVVEIKDGIRYTDVCLFTRVLRKPEKVLRQMPEVAKARQTEIQYDAGCLEWSTWAEPDREKIKPIRTGFVDAIKVDEASGVSKYKSRLVIYGNQMVPFQHFNPYETSSPVAQHIFF